MNQRVFTTVNFLLLLVSAACIYYIATAEYDPPEEISEMEPILQGLKDGVSPGETEFSATIVETPPSDWVFPGKPIMNPLYSPTPTPEPTPSPTPAPPPLKDLVVDWVIQGMQPDVVEIYADREKVTFPLRVGESHNAADKKGTEWPVQLKSIDMGGLKIVVTFAGQEHEITW